MKRCCCVVALLLWCTAPALAENWPQWRGPTGQGHTSEKDLPLKWGPTENVRWKVSMPAPNNSTPAVWGDRIFLTTANTGGTKRGILCLNRADGKTLWTREIDYTEKERAYNQNYYGSASPATDGERVVVSYGSAGVYCYDFSGKELWKRDLGKFDHQFGNASSPVIYEDLVIFWAGPDPKNNALYGLNKKTGETVWETKEKGGSWSTPVIAKVDGKDQILLSIPFKFKGYDPKTGKELWSCDGLTDLNYTSPLYSNGIAVAMSGYNKAALAVKLGGSGDITRDRLWHHPNNEQRVGSGAIVGDHVYILEETGIPHCYELKTGKEVWKAEKLRGGSTWSSMLVSGDRLYVLTKNGDTYVFAASPKYELLATSKLGEGAHASIVPSEGELLIRTFKNLWCISEKKK